MRNMANYRYILSSAQSTGRSGRVVAILIAGALLASCSSAGETTRTVVRNLNPVNWFEEDPKDAQKKPLEASKPGAEKKSFPKLGSVPKRPARPSPEEQTKQIAEGLAADTENARYSDQQLRQSTAVFGGRPQPRGAVAQRQPVPARAPAVTVPSVRRASSSGATPRAPAARASVLPPPAIRPPSAIKPPLARVAPPTVKPPAAIKRRPSTSRIVPPPVVAPPARVTPPPVVAPPVARVATPKAAPPLPQAPRTPARTTVSRAVPPPPPVISRAPVRPAPSVAQLPASRAAAPQVARRPAASLSSPPPPVVTKAPAPSRTIARQVAPTRPTVAPSRLPTPRRAAPVVAAPTNAAPASRSGFVTPVGQPTEAPKPAPQPRPLRGPGSEQVVPVQPPGAARIGASTAASTQTPISGIPKSLQVGTIYFNDGSSKLSSRDVTIITAVTEVFGQTGGRVRVIGHSSMGARTFDPARREVINFQMSLKRANAVANELIRQGVPAESVEVVAEGDRAPAYQETTQTGAAHNRRTEIIIDYMERS